MPKMDLRTVDRPGTTGWKLFRLAGKLEPGGEDQEEKSADLRGVCVTRALHNDVLVQL